MSVFLLPSPNLIVNLSSRATSSIVSRQVKFGSGSSSSLSSTSMISPHRTLFSYCTNIVITSREGMWWVFYFPFFNGIEKVINGWEFSKYAISFLEVLNRVRQPASEAASSEVTWWLALAACRWPKFFGLPVVLSQRLLRHPSLLWEHDANPHSCNRNQGVATNISLPEEVSYPSQQTDAKFSMHQGLIEELPIALRPAVQCCCISGLIFQWNQDETHSWIFVWF